MRFSQRTLRVLLIVNTQPRYLQAESGESQHVVQLVDVGLVGAEIGNVVIPIPPFYVFRPCI